MSARLNREARWWFVHARNVFICETDDEYDDDVRAIGVLIVVDDIISIEMDACWIDRKCKRKSECVGNGKGIRKLLKVKFTCVHLAKHWPNCASLNVNTACNSIRKWVNEVLNRISSRFSPHEISLNTRSPYTHAHTQAAACKWMDWNHNLNRFLL